MEEAKERSKTLPSVHYVEYAGKPGAAPLDDEENWHSSKPRPLPVGIKSLTGFMRAQAEAAAITHAKRSKYASGALHLNERP